MVRHFINTPDIPPEPYRVGYNDKGAPITVRDADNQRVADIFGVDARRVGALLVRAPETARRLEDLAAAAEALLDAMGDGCGLADDCREERSGVFHASSCPEAIALRAAIARARGGV